MYLALLLVAIAAPWRAPVDGLAVDQPQSKKVVFAIRAGATYELVKRGGPDKAWCKVQEGKLVGWTVCTEGQAEEREAPQTNAKCSTSCSSKPLFKELPELSAVDREVLALCPKDTEQAVTL